MTNKIIFLTVFAVISISGLFIIKQAHSANQEQTVALTINLEKSASFRVKSDTWFYDNLENINAEIVVTNYSNKEVNITASNCIFLKVSDLFGKSIISKVSNQNDFCVDKIDSQKKHFKIEPFREYYYYVDVGIGVLPPGAYKLQVVLGDTTINAEQKFYVIDPADACLGIPKITNNEFLCPITDDKKASDNVSLNLKLQNGYVSNKDGKSSDASVSIANKSDSVVRLMFTSACIKTNILDLDGNKIKEDIFNPPICMTNYINIGTGFLKSKRFRILELKPKEEKIIVHPNTTLPDTEKSLPLPIQDVQQGKYSVKLDLGDKNISSDSARIQITTCDVGYTADQEGKCIFNPRQFYQDKIAFELDFEKIPSILGEPFKVYATLRNLSDKDIKIQVPSNECYSYNLYAQNNLQIEQIAKLPYTSEAGSCQNDPSDSTKKLILLPASKQDILTLDIKAEYFSLFNSNTSRKTLDFMIEGKVEENIKSKLIKISVANFVKSGSACGGEFNLLCEDDKLICQYESDLPNAGGICAVKKEDEYYFLDTAGHFAENFIEELRIMGILEGYPGRLFKPNQVITRAEFIKMIVTGLKYELASKTTSSFSDVDIHDWFSPYVETAKEMEIIEGYRDDKGYLLNVFKPMDIINRAEAVKIIVKSFNIKEFTTTQPPFSDISENGWYYKYLYSAFNSKAQLIEGFENNTFQPSGPLTRGQASKIIYLGLKK